MNEHHTSRGNKGQTSSTQQVLGKAQDTFFVDEKVAGANNCTYGYFQIFGEAMYYDGMTLDALIKKGFKINNPKTPRAGGLYATDIDPKFKFEIKDTSQLLRRVISVGWDCCKGQKNTTIANSQKIKVHPKRTNDPATDPRNSESIM